MATLLDPSEPEVRAAADTAREILVRLEARPFIARLDAAMSRATAPEPRPHPSISRRPPRRRPHPSRDRSTFGYSPHTVTCPTCGATNPPDGRFCLECGSALGGCPTCGTQNPSGARFCGNCGTSLGAAAATSRPAQTGPAPEDPRAGATERRVVSVLFADLVGFTSISADRDPETIRELQNQYFERTRVIVDRYGGIIEKFIGDAVMAMWGAPVAFEDDAERAVRAGLELVDMVPALGRELGVDLDIRVGVLTGEAAVTLGSDGQGMVTGDMVNTAARLQSVAPTGGVLVGEATRIAAEAAIEFIPAGDQALKGKDSPGPVLAGRPRRRRTRRCPPPGRAGAAIRRTERRAALPQGAVPHGRTGAPGQARLARRAGRHRQEPSRLGAREVPRRRRRAGLVAPRSLARRTARASRSGHSAR